MIMTRRSITCFILGVSLFHCQSCKKHTEEVQSSEPAPAATPVSLHGSTDSFDASKSKHPSQILFNGDSLPLGMDWSNASLSLDPQRHIWSNYSLRWDWKAPSSVTFHRPIPWMDPRAARRKFKFSQPTQNCFVVWIYNQTAKPDASLRFSFGTGSKEVCHFPFALNFTGWRTAWVSYDRDMQGAPKSAMDYVKIESPKTWTKGLCGLVICLLTILSIIVISMEIIRCPLSMGPISLLRVIGILLCTGTILVKRKLLWCSLRMLIWLPLLVSVGYRVVLHSDRSTWNCAID